MTVHHNINFNHNTMKTFAALIWTAHVLQLTFWYYSLNFPPNHKAEILTMKPEDRSLVQRLYIRTVTDLI